MKHTRRIQCTPVHNLRLAQHLQTLRLPRATLGRLPGGSSTVTSRAPNVAYSRGMVAARACSASPGLRRSPSPLGVSVAQRRAQLAEQSAATAISGIGHVEKETRRVCEMVEATTAEARSVCDNVESRVATLAAVVDASAARTVDRNIEPCKGSSGVL